MGIVCLNEMVGRQLSLPPANICCYLFLCQTLLIYRAQKSITKVFISFCIPSAISIHKIKKSFYHINFDDRIFLVLYSLDTIIHKVQIFWEGHKNLAHLPIFIWHFKWKMGKICVAFSEYPNFNSCIALFTR